MGKKILATLFIMAAGAWAVFYFFIKETPASSETNQSGPLAFERSSDLFTASMQDVLSSYFTMTAAFVEEDSSKANAAASAFAKAIEAVPADQLKADSSIIALVASLKSNVQQSALGIPGETNWDEKRHGLQACSDMLFDMLRTVQYKGGKVYQQFCPMAFDNAGANWLSNDAAIRNPYFGDKMLECGEVKDSISFNQ
jgi:Cu(I)/Ag(I) efflux system membrane fusion protein